MRQQPFVLCLGAVGMLGCALNAETSHTRSETFDIGSLGLAIAVAPGLDISSVNYSVQVPGLEAIEGSLPLGADGIVRGKIDDVPVADAVLVVLSASNAAGVVCSGQSTLSVRAGEVASLAIGMQCRVPASTPVPSTGSISIQGTLNACPRLLAASSTPQATNSTTAVTAGAEDVDADPIAFTWSASAGAFANASVASTTYTCGAAGEAMLTVTVNDGRGCTDSKVVLVACETPAEPPPPPPPVGTDIPCAVQTVLKAKCQACHGDPPTSGPMPLVTLAQLHADSPGAFAGTPVYQRVKERINHATSPMPPSWGTTGALSQAEKDTLNDWLLADAPGATCAVEQGAGL